MVPPRPVNGACCAACAAKAPAPAPRMRATVERQRTHAEPDGDEAPVVNVYLNGKSAGGPSPGVTRHRIVAAGAPAGYRRGTDGRVYRPPSLDAWGSPERAAGGLYRSAGAPGDRVGVPSVWQTMGTPQRRAWAEGVARNQEWTGTRATRFVESVLSDGPEYALRNAGILDEPRDPSTVRYPTAGEWATMGEPERRAWAQRIADDQRMSDQQEQRFITDVLRLGLDGARNFIQEYYTTERARIRANADVQVARYTGQARAESDYVRNPGTTTTPVTTTTKTSGVGTAIGIGTLFLLASRFAK